MLADCEVASYTNEQSDKVTCIGDGIGLAATPARWAMAIPWQRNLFSATLLGVGVGNELQSLNGGF